MIEFFTKRAVLTHTLFVVLVVISILSYSRVSKELFPSSTLDKITVSGGYLSSSAENLNKMAVVDIEEEFKSYSEVSSIETVIHNGVFSITVSLKPGSDKLSLLSDFKSIVSNLKRNFPSDMDEPRVTIVKKAFPLIFVSISGEDEDTRLDVADALKNEILENRFISQVHIDGDGDKELRFVLDSKKIEAYALDKSSVISSLSTLYTILPIGKIESREHYFVSTVNGENNLTKILNTKLSVGAKQVYVKDIARVEFKRETPDRIGKFNGERNILLDIRKGELGDAIVLSREIRTIVNRYRNAYPTLTFGFSTDTSIWVRNRLNTVTSNILFGLILVFLSMWVFINKRISFIVIIGIPTSYAIGMIFLDYLDFSLNLLSMLGALIALGMIVDEAIVVAENIQRRLEEGEERLQAAINGTKEVFWPVVAAALTTIFAFLPLLMVEGEMGIFMQILPVMISILIFSSLIEAFIFLPLHAKEVLSPKADAAEAFWVFMRNIYKKILSFLLKYRYITILIFIVAVPFLIMQGFMHSRFQMFPEFDTTQIYVTGKVDVNSTVEESAKKVEKVEAVLKKYLGDDMESFTTVVGMKLNAKREPDSGENYFQIFVDLYDKVPTDSYNRYIAPLLSLVHDDEKVKRTKSAREIARLIREELKSYDFDELNVFVPGAGIVKSDIEISLSHLDDAKLREGIERLQAKMETIQGVYNISNDATLGAKKLKLKINAYGESLGIDETMIVNQLRGFIAEAQYAKMFGEKLIKIILKEKDKNSLAFLDSFSLTLKSSKKILLKDVTDIVLENSFQKLHKYDGKKQKSVFGFLEKQTLTSDEFFVQIDSFLETLRKEGFVIEIKGEKQTNAQVMEDLKYSFVIALLLIFITLTAMFNSIFLPFVVISTIPLSLLGVLVGNAVIGLNMTMIGMIGVVGLMGVVVNDGIIMIEFIKKVKNIDELIDRASYRVRPILLTSLTTVLGLLTLIFFPFGQSVILQPMAVALGFGLAWSTVLNLFYLPLFFGLIKRLKL